MRALRRRLGLTQQELAYVMGYEERSHVSHIETGIRMPHLAEVLIIELIFGVPAVMIFPQIRLAVGMRLGHRLRRVVSAIGESDSTDPRMSYKAAQLRRVLASLRSRDEFEESESCFGTPKVI